jgi:hypothetical protein
MTPQMESGLAAAAATAKGALAAVSAAPYRPTHRLARSTALLVGIIGASSLLFVPTVAQATSRTKAMTEHSQVANPATLESSAVCSRVSAAAVSAIVGFSMPAQAAYDGTSHQSATKQSHGISGVATRCFYGTPPKLVVLGSDTVSKPISLQTIERTTKADAGSGAQVVFTSYPGLGSGGILITIRGGGENVETIGSISGKTEFTAGETIGIVPVSKLASLAKLAKKL